MDTFEILSAIRNILKKHSQKSLSNSELLRALNLANGSISGVFYPLFKDDLIVELESVAQTGDYNLPGDILLIVNVYRKDSSDAYQLATRVVIEKKPLLGTNQLPSNEYRPFYVQMGKHLEFTPALSTTDIKLEYRKRISDLVFGEGTSASDKTYITLDSFAPVRDDLLNGYWLALYKETDGVPLKVDQVLITDYDGSTKKAYCTTPEASQAYIYALAPILPSEFHHFLVKETLVMLADSGYYEKDGDILEKRINGEIMRVFQSYGIAYETEGK